MHAQNESQSPVTLIAIDDDPASLELISDTLEQADLQILTATDPRAGLDLVREKRPEIVLLDLLMPGVSGMELLEKILVMAPETEIILVTGHYSTESAVEAIQKGASDYITKPLSVPALRHRIGILIQAAQQRRSAARLDSELLRASEFEGMVGRSSAMLDVFSRIRRVAPHFRSVLVTGETGTGKELVARALHRISPAGSGRFAVCNASAVVETLFESELFGHKRGAFTGAIQDKVGLFEYANGGTVFLDEIGDMPLSTQTKLLRVLQTHEVQRVGSLESRKVDVRVIAATNRPLRAMNADKQFREDLYYRLSMVEIKLPTLAERKEDLSLLAQCFIGKFSEQYRKTIRGISPRAQTVLSRYAWPGNVRELENVIGHACMMTEGETLSVFDLPDYLTARSDEARSEDEGDLPLAEVERRHATRVLARVGGNKVRAAKILGINRATLARLVDEQRSK
ncbi:MAG: sigma-54-dependent Fis family transcriptional regulator [Acidobacteria bacterium]|nr:MAG: sigma-54-dependent Fis family transcriptional regulator [Acidobacteriota bacterium]